MTKLLSTILFCVFPLIALSQEAPKVADDNAAAEASQANEKAELSKEQKEYNFCVMQGALQVVSMVRVCANEAVAGFIAEHGQEKLQESSIEDIGAECFQSGASVIEGVSEKCKELNSAAEAESKDLPVKAKE